ncbi:hypothetical protein OGAPHI_005698 [Ogataea philodendri]|uniref:Uncharacterized protein n=1 Tax=Ogataea philodendri TaxID=1378263 RepID=A0A9P8T1E2_9ASCO|nr:uncharacterized protein OGAPHI_005698 [Ogataea philodendri]KAH3662446.1 hypothetical protein OGAPHI_005698 [Ogataea philodendri]
MNTELELLSTVLLYVRKQHNKTYFKSISPEFSSGTVSNAARSPVTLIMAGRGIKRSGPLVLQKWGKHTFGGSKLQFFRQWNIDGVEVDPLVPHTQKLFHKLDSNQRGFCQSVRSTCRFSVVSVGDSDRLFTVLETFHCAADSSTGKRVQCGGVSSHVRAADHEIDRFLCNVVYSDVSAGGRGSIQKTPFLVFWVVCIVWIWTSKWAVERVVLWLVDCGVNVRSGDGLTCKMGLTDPRFLHRGHTDGKVPVSVLLDGFHQVDEVLFEVWVQCGGINCVSVVLGGDVTFSRDQVQSWDVVCSVSVLELDGLGTRGQSQQLVTQTDSKDRKLWVLVHSLSQVFHGSRAVSRVSRSVRDENSVELVGNVLHRVVIRQNGDGCSTRHQRPQDIFLDTAIKNSNMVFSVRRRNMERSFGCHLVHKVDSTWIVKRSVFICVIGLANTQLGQTRTLFSQIRNQLSGIDTSDSCHSFTLTPLTQTFNSSPMGVLQSNVTNNNSNTLDVRRLEVLEEVELISGSSGWDTIVTNQRLCEHQDLSSIRRISH